MTAFRLAILLLFSVCAATLAAQDAARFERIDAYEDPEGYYLFLPSDSVRRAHDSLNLAVFFHGYGALNPLNYGGWLQQLLDAGTAVVYPRYQRNLYVPGTKRFAPNAAAGARKGIALLRERYPRVRTDSVQFFGHSYGGVLASTLATRGSDYGLPPVSTVFAVAPGTNRFRGSRLDTYVDMPSHVKLVVLSHEDDSIVGDEFPRLLHETCPAQMQRVWLHQRPVNHVDESCSATHNECYAPRAEFDTGYRNYTTRKALRVGRQDAVDTELVYRLSRGLLRYRRTGRLPRVLHIDEATYAFGAWSDGTPREGIKISRPAHEDGGDRASVAGQ